MTNEKQIIILPNNKIVYREVHDYPLKVTADVINSMAASCLFSQRSVFRITGGQPVNARFGQSDAWYTTLLPALTLKCPWLMIKEKDILVPNLGSRDDPVISIDWTPPTGMGLLVLNRITSNRWNGTWLVACCRNGDTTEFYRLPMGNLYLEDSQVCMGDNGIAGNSHQEIIESSLQVLKSASWNADLWGKVDLTQRMFRFKPNKKGFEQQPVDGDWKDLCQRKDSDNLQKIMI